MNLKEAVINNLKEAAKEKKERGKQYFLYAHWVDIKELLNMGIKQTKIYKHFNNLLNINISYSTFNKFCKKMNEAELLKREKNKNEIISKIPIKQMENTASAIIDKNIQLGSRKIFKHDPRKKFKG